MCIANIIYMEAKVLIASHNKKINYMNDGICSLKGDK